MPTRPDRTAPAQVGARRARVEAAFERFARGVIRWRWLAIAATAAATLALGSLLPDLRVDNSDESFLRPDAPARVAYDAFQEQFGREDRLMVLFEPPKVFDLEFLALVREIHRAIERDAPYVTEVTSLINARNTRGEGDRLVVEDLTEDWPHDQADLDAMRARVFSNPLLVNTLVSRSERVTVIAIEPFTYTAKTPEIDVLAGFDDAGAESTHERPDYLLPEEQNELIDAVEAILAPFQARYGDRIPMTVTGGMVIDKNMNAIMTSDMTTTAPLTLALMLGILWLLFRSVAGALLPLVVVLGSVIAAVGAMVLLDIPFSITLNILPPLLITVGICDAIHILTIVFQRLGQGDTRDDAIAFAVGHSGLAVVMTSLTTAAGLASFSTAEFAAVGDLGLIAPLGVLAAMVYSLVLLPALLAVTPLRSRRTGPGRVERFALERILAPLARAATSHPGAVLAGTAVAVAIATTGVAQLRFSHDGIRWFPEDDPVRVSAELLDDEFEGTATLEAVIDTGTENGLHDPALLARMEAAMRFSEGLRVGEHRVAQATSIVDVVKEINRALNGDAEAAHVVPPDRRLVAQELLLFENSGSDDLEDVTDSLFSLGRLSVRTPWVDAMVYPDFVDEVEAGFAAIFGGAARVEITGGARIFSALFKAVNSSLTRSYVIALVVITPLLVLLVGNLKRGLLAMVPNLIPVYFTLALMGWLDIPLDASTLLIGGVVLGVAVDDTIHFMHKFNRYEHESGDAVLAVRQTLATTGAALLFTSLVLFFGFGVFATTYLVNTQWFGMLAAFATVVAFLADVLIASALMVWIAPRAEPAA